MCLVWPLCGALAILKNKKKFGMVLQLQIQYCRTLNIYSHMVSSNCTSKSRKINRKWKEIKKIYNFILRKMYITGLELQIPDSRGQCASYCAMGDLKFGACICPIYRQPIFRINLNTDKSVSMQSELLACLPTL